MFRMLRKGLGMEYEVGVESTEGTQTLEGAYLPDLEMAIALAKYIATWSDEKIESKVSIKRPFYRVFVDALPNENSDYVTHYTIERNGEINNAG